MYFKFPNDYLYPVEECRDLYLEIDSIDEIQNFRTSLNVNFVDDIDEEYANSKVESTKGYLNN